jgi:WD40 repeat protein
MSWQRLSRRSERYTSLAFRADGQILIAGAHGGWVRWWQTADGAPLRISMRPGQPIWSVALAPDGQHVGAGLADGTTALWRLGEPRPSRIFAAPGPSATTGVAFAPDGQHLAAWDDGALRVWQMRDGALRWALPTVPGGIAVALWTPDGRWLATTGGHGPVCLWRSADGALLHTWESPWAAEPALAFGRNGQLLAIGQDSGRVQVWQVPSGPLLYELRGLPEAIRGVAYTPWGNVLAAGDATGAVAVATDAGAQVRYGHPAPVRSLGLTLNTRTLVVVAEDGTVSTWAVQEGPTLAFPRVWAPPYPECSIRQAVFAPDRRAVAALTGDDAVWLWRAPAPAGAFLPT